MRPPERVDVAVFVGLPTLVEMRLAKYRVQLFLGKSESAMRFEDLSTSRSLMDERSAANYVIQSALKLALKTTRSDFVARLAT